ncbi:MAG: hypothetical protein HQL30_08360 [Candidatus Omnitrophica bacterium]|nr:hypothetical protein [Candidatus Omnitrophota bacterium]
MNTTPENNSFYLKVGDKFAINGELFILAQTDFRNVTLVSLKSGKHWSTPIKIKNSSMIPCESILKMVLPDSLVPVGEEIESTIQEQIDSAVKNSKKNLSEKVSDIFPSRSEGENADLTVEDLWKKYARDEDDSE